MKFLSKNKISNNRYKTPEGYLICLDCIIARTGKQDYAKNEVFQDSEDESIISIDRPYNEVFSPSTIASFENKPLVDEHPDEDVNVDNYRDYSGGFVRDVRASKEDGKDVLVANIVVTDPEIISEIENGKVDLSCGYECDILGTEPNLYQANIRGNHVALCKAGRAGIAKIKDSENINDLPTTKRDELIDKLVADEEEAIEGYKKAMEESDEADKSIYSFIINEELEHITKLKSLKNEKFENENIIEDSKIKDIDFKFLSEEAKNLKEELNLYKKQIGSHCSTEKREYTPRQNQKNNEYVKELNESINQGIKFLSEGNYNKQAWVRLALNLESWKGEPELKNICKKAETAIKKFTKYINEKNREEKHMRDGALRGIHLKRIRETLKNEDENLVEDFLDYMDTRPDLVKEYDNYNERMVEEDFESWKKYGKIEYSLRDVDSYEEVTKDLTKESEKVKDSKINKIIKISKIVNKLKDSKVDVLAKVTVKDFGKLMPIADQYKVYIEPSLKGPFLTLRIIGEKNNVIKFLTVLDDKAWLEYYPKGYEKYFDSIKDSKIKDSPASNIVSEIKKAYPEVKTKIISKKENGYHITLMVFENYPKGKLQDNWLKFIKYLYKKYVPSNEKNNVSFNTDYNRLNIYEKL